MGNPLSYTDPNGKFALPLIKAGIEFFGAGMGDAAVQLYNIYKSGG